MSTATNAAEQLRNFNNKIKPLIEAVEFLEALGNLEQATAEYKARAEKAQADCVRIEKQLSELATKEQEAGGRVKALEVQGSETAKAAEERASKIIQNAQADAEKIVAEANQKAADVEGATAQRKRFSESLDKSIAAKEAELARLNEEIQKTKARITAL